MVLGTLVLGAVMGSVYARMVQRASERSPGDPSRLSRGRPLIVLAFVVWLAWLISVGTFWPLLASYDNGARGRTARVANFAGLFAGLVSYAIVLVLGYWSIRRWTEAPGVWRWAAVGRRRRANQGLAFEAISALPSVIQESTLACIGNPVGGGLMSKWIDRIELSTSLEEGFYEQQKWSPDSVVRTQSRITGPDFAALRGLLPVTLLGTAFAGDRGVSKVEVSADDGRTWQPATITYPGSRLTWSLWSYSGTPTRAPSWPSKPSR